MGSQQARIPLSASKHFVTMPSCAYCAREAPLTREHLIPAFMYDYQKQFTPFIEWSELAEKTVGGELQIKDVCAPCNNGPLSALDDYGWRMLTEYGLQANQPWPTLFGTLQPTKERTNYLLRVTILGNSRPALTGSAHPVLALQSCTRPDPE